MTQKMFGVYDIKACAYLQPFFSINAGSALRAFEDCLQDEKSNLARHPADYQLFELGAFDDASGELTSVTPPKFLVLLSDFVAARLAAPGAELVDGTK